LKLELAPLERRPLLLVAATTVVGVFGLHCKTSPLPDGETGVASGEGERRMDRWFVEGTCIFIAKVLAPVGFRDGNWECMFLRSICRGQGIKLYSLDEKTRNS
jgi:hypothetical protein